MLVLGSTGHILDGTYIIVNRVTAKQEERQVVFDTGQITVPLVRYD